MWMDRYLNRRKNGCGMFEVCAVYMDLYQNGSKTNFEYKESGVCTRAQNVPVTS